MSNFFITIRHHADTVDACMAYSLLPQKQFWISDNPFFDIS